ncbi:GNAT family N-acetyltransferase [Mesorhizobium amorphae]|uniref:GNAT family N-acetyltransferase n=1 Tax=Mesorhizobium amorphae TaxID=71433 RepID=UPI001185B88D|nr:GNAT family N-acetyltransferase [Mesorhizobium amorphae]
MNYSKFIKKLELPSGFVAPTRLTFGNLVAQAITRQHLSDDVRGINASISLIRRTRGGAWPEGPVTEDFNYVDLVWHEQEFREGTSFTYAVYETDCSYLGCCYFYPIGRRTELSEQLSRHDVDVSWWVTPEAYERGVYQTLYVALRHWVGADLQFRSPYFSNIEIPCEI